jgi:hypothetical protein
VAGYLLKLPVGKEIFRYWELVWNIASAENVTSRGSLTVFVIFWGLVLVVPCLGVGWVLQALTQTLLAFLVAQRGRRA